MSRKFSAALDVGGSNIQIVLANKNQQIVARLKIATYAEAGPERVIEQLVDAVWQIIATCQAQRKDLTAVGVCIAGFYDWQKRLLVHSPNLSGWSNVPLESILVQKFGVPVLVENDANAAAVGETRLGAGANQQSVIFITISTGIGAGLVLNGQLYRGHSGLAGELGHFIVQPGGASCGCGQQGCLEAVASGTAIARRARAAILSGQATNLQTLVNNPAAVTAEDVFRAASAGDSLAQGIIDEAIYYLGLALVSIINLFNPSVVVLGGGVSAAGEALLTPLRRIVKEHAISTAARDVQLKPAALGEEAGVVGMLNLLQELNEYKTFL